MRSNWYEHFFHGVALDVWRQVVTPEQTQQDVEFLLAELEVSAGSHLLDVPCGNGRHSLELATRNIRMTGVDLAEEFIHEARSRAAASGLEVEWLQGDMRRLPWEARFDGAFCFGNSFAYLEDSGTRDFLAALSRTLKPGTRFVIDTGVAAESILPKLQDRRWMQIDDILFLSASRYDVADSRLDIQYTFVRDGKQETREASSHVYTVAEIRRMLLQAGFETLRLYASTDRQPYQLGSPRLLLVARRL